MAGAESQRRFDLDADAIERDAGAVVGAVHDEAAGGDGSQSGEAFAHPIRRRDALEAQRFGGSVACGRGGQRAYYFLIGRGTKMHRHPPAAGADIHKAHRNFVGRKSSRRQDRRPGAPIVHRFRAGATMVGLSLEGVSERIVLSGAFKALPGIHKARAPADRGAAPVQSIHRAIHPYPQCYAEPFPRLFHRMRGGPFRSFLPAECHMKSGAVGRE